MTARLTITCLSLATFLLLPSCQDAPASSGSSCEDLGETSDFTILRDQTSAELGKYSIDLQVSAPITEQQLRTNAEIIKCENPGYERYFITYWLPDYKLDAGAWAITHFNPTLEVQILALQN